MDPLTLIVSIVTIVGVAWALFAGSRTITEAATDLRRWWAERRGKCDGAGQPTHLRPALVPLITEVVTSSADLSEVVSAEERIRRLEHSHQKVQQQLAHLEQRYPEPSRPPKVTTRHTQLRSRADSIQNQMARLRGKATGQFARTESLVNRQREIKMIWDAILDSSDLRILYFYGKGGVGKTRLLEEVGRLIENPRGRGNSGQQRLDSLLKKLLPWRRQAVPAFAWCNIVDLYHTDLHNSPSIQQAIAAAADPDGTQFQNYRRVATEFQKARWEAIDSRQLESMRKKLSEAFVQDYNALAATQRIVLAFDTLEVIQHESPIVQKVCQIEPDPVAVEAWLLHGLQKLQNSVVLLAGRPREDLFSKFQRAYSVPRQFEKWELGNFTWSETQDYVRLLAQQRPEVEIIPKDMLWHIHLTAEGLPVRLAMMLHLILDRGLERKLSHSTEVDAVLGQNLFAELEQDEPLMFYLALARKGLDAELLHYLEPDCSVSECRRRLAALQNLAYIKTRPGILTLFLHDELYALFSLSGPKQSHAWYTKIGKYYYTRQHKSIEKHDQEAWQQAAVNWLFYRLRADPHRGYQSYIRLAEEAVKGHNFGFDMQLRDEMLRFFHPTNGEMDEHQDATRRDFDRDATLRWIRRYIEKGNYAAACQVVKNVRESNNPLFSGDHLLFYGTLDTYYGEAVQYMGKTLPEALEVLDKAVECLNALEPDDDFERWWYARILGRAYNNIGYIHWQRQCYSRASEAFQAARSHYEATGVRDELADTLNNLAFVFGVVGRFDDAEREVNKALELREALGQRYPQALSLNTLGLIQLGAGRLQQAQKHCLEALWIFEELNAVRGQGLAYIALGEICRQTARQCTETTEAIASLQRAETRLKQAIDIFSEQRINEPLRWVEATNELGCTYRDWAMRMEQDEQSNGAQALCEKAQYWLQRSIEKARGKWPVMMVDSCEDMARLFFERGMFRDASQWLERTEDIIPEEYYIQGQEDFSDISEPVEGFWLMLGKTHLLHGHLSHKIGDLQTSLQQYALALSYLDKYSSTVPAFQRARSEIRRQLSELSPDQQKLAQRFVDDPTMISRISANNLSALLPGRHSWL